MRYRASGIVTPCLLSVRQKKYQTRPLGPPPLFSVPPHKTEDWPTGNPDGLVTVGRVRRDGVRRPPGEKENGRRETTRQAQRSPLSPGGGSRPVRLTGRCRQPRGRETNSRCGIPRRSYPPGRMDVSEAGSMLLGNRKIFDSLKEKWGGGREGHEDGGLQSR